MRTVRRWPRGLALLVAVTALPAVLAGCSMFSTDTPDADATRAPGDSWLVVDEGVAQPSATTTNRRVLPSPTPSSGFLHRRSPRPTRAPEPLCTAFQRQGQINGLTAVAGAGMATASWYNPAGRTLVKYRLAAVPQHLVAGLQEPPAWQEIKPDKVCGIMTATVTGLDPGKPYILSLDAVVTRVSGDGDVGSTVARSGVFYPR